MAKKNLQLGRSVKLPASPEEAVLDAVPNPHTDSDYLVRFTAPEFTTLCPITGQPDFAHFVIDYAPAERSWRSKSLKLFLHSFRNASGFHEGHDREDRQAYTASDQAEIIRVAGLLVSRGGMPIDVFWQTGKLPSGVWLPETGVQPYRGRG
jgi:7-cyano-7-deazaguanine reductase